jgi:Holliday junction resolvase RusA-like endonuclease
MDMSDHSAIIRTELVLSCSIDGEPRGKERARSTRSGRHYTPNKTKSWEHMASIIMRNSYRGEQIKNEPLLLIVDAVKSRRKSDKVKERFLRRVKPDIDNVIKAVADALEKSGVIKNDALIAQVISTSWHCAIDERPCVEVQLWQIKQGAS